MPHEFGYPGLPVLSDEERLRRNALQQQWRRPSVDALRAQQEQETADFLQAAYPDEGQQIDRAIADAKNTLAYADDFSARTTRQADETGRNRQAEEQALGRLQQEASLPALARKTASYASIPASFLGGPVGIAAGVVQAADALEGLADPESNKLIAGGQAALSALPLVKAGKAGFRAISEAAQSPSLGRAIGEFSPLAGPGSPLRPSIAAMVDDAPPAPVDLTDELSALAEPALDSNAARMAERYGRNFRSEAGTPGDSALRRFIAALGGDAPPPSISRMTAQEALEGGDEAAKRNILFGGASSSQEGTFGPFVRPQKRSPIGKGPTRRGEGDDAITWNINRAAL